MRGSFQDIIPPENRSIKKIPIPDRNNLRPSVNPPVIAKRYPAMEEEEERVPVKQEPRLQTPSKRPHTLRLILIALFAIIIIGGIVFWMSAHAKAGIIVYEDEQQVLVSGNFSASQAGVTGLHFQTITITRDGKLAVPASSVQNVTTKAKGTIVIYNNYSSSPQKLVANTRFQSASGLIFRIADPVTIPGTTLQGGKTVPGSVEAVVTADAAGSNYNVGLTDFSIPGFKDDAGKYSGFYARSKTAIDGGASGSQNVADPSQQTTAIAKIQDELKVALLKEALKDIPAGFVFPQNAYTINFTSVPSTQAGTSTITLAEEATLSGAIFNQQELIAAIMTATSTNPMSAGVVVEPNSLNQLIFSLITSSKSKVATTTPFQNQTISFSLKGSVSLIPDVNITELQLELAGKPRTSLNAIIANYQGISSAKVNMRPFWLQSFPSKISDISIVVSTSTSTH